ncbi:MAG: hypothetical protein AB1305_04850, partial [Candidatus Hadarchaeota archaeon]
FDFILTLAAAMLVYSGSEFVFGMGTGAIAILFFGLMLGNSGSFSKVTKRRYTLAPNILEFHSGITFAMRSFFFVYLGLVATIRMEYLFYGVVLSAALMIFRLVAVQLAMVGTFISKPEMNLMRVMGTKGLVAAALTQIPATYGVPGAELIQNIAFVVILSTTIYAAVGTAVIARGKHL